MLTQPRNDPFLVRPCSTFHAKTLNNNFRIPRVHSKKPRLVNWSRRNNCGSISCSSECDDDISGNRVPGLNYSLPSRNWRSKNQDYSPGWGTPVFVGNDNKPDGGTVNTAQTVDDKKTEPFKGKSGIIRPRRIILVRHGQSEGNVDETYYTKIPDSKIALTRKGWNEAVKCGERIRSLIESDADENWKAYFYVSPYLRTLQTLRGIGLNFDKERIAGVREEPRLREQDFGNFQDREKMRIEKAIRLRYGRFFYRFPDGESAADVYDRITGFRETLRADIDIGRFQKPETATCNMNLVLVSHGLTLRVFLMRWYKWTVEQFERLYNFPNAGLIVMQLGQGGRYTLAIHHTEEELRGLGLSQEMIEDQIWQVSSKPGDLNPEWQTSGPSFFDHFEFLESGNPQLYIPNDLSDAVEVSQ